MDHLPPMCGVEALAHPSGPDQPDHPVRPEPAESLNVGNGFEVLLGRSIHRNIA
jgi:hypothetical protein